MRISTIFICLFVLIFSSSTSFASGKSEGMSEKPGIVDAVVLTLEAKVEDINKDSRMVTLKGPEGNTVTIQVDEEVKNLAQVEKGDLVTVEYIEAISVQLFPKGAAVPNLTAIEIDATADSGQKPAGISMGEITIVATIDAINMDENLVTLKGVEGKTKTFKARNPEMLAKAEVGDTVQITVIEAFGISVTEN